MIKAISDFSTGTTIAEAVTIPGVEALVGAVVGAGAEGVGPAHPASKTARIRNMEPDNFFIMMSY
jgi:hypothetical protein